MGYTTGGGTAVIGGAAATGVLAHTGAEVSPLWIALAILVIVGGIVALIYAHRRNRREGVISGAK